MGVLFMMMAFLLFFVLFYVFFIVPTMWLKVERVHLPLGIHKKILQISDIHIERSRVKVSTVEKLIKKEHPDYIFITGDIVDLKIVEAKLIPFLEMLRDSGVSVYAVFGNHDYYLEDTSPLEELLAYHNVRLLKNEHVREDGFRLVGIDDFRSGKHDIEKAFRGVSDEETKVIMTHDPNIIYEILEPFDYMMSGHLHGKQVNIPFLFTFKDMGPLPASGVYKGLHKNRFGTFYISKGMGQSRYNIRFMVRSEVTIHNV